MLQYLIIQLDDTSTPICHYDNSNTVSKLIGIDKLEEGILYAMKENLTIQFLYPDFVLPEEYKSIIDTIDHVDIVSSLCEDNNLVDSADVIVFHDWTAFDYFTVRTDKYYVLRTSKNDFFDRYKLLLPIIRKAGKLNVVFTDINTFGDADFRTYKQILSFIADGMVTLYKEGLSPQFNLLTDRMMLGNMNNCNAGCASLTLAPDGSFYVCPAFYLADEKEDYGLGKAKFDVGNLKKGVDIKNPQLYQLDHAPICNHCDAFQCKRCVWLNRKMTMEINTPSHEQCVLSHIERNASRYLLGEIRKHGSFLDGTEIKKVDYLDPFENIENW